MKTTFISNYFLAGFIIVFGCNSREEIEEQKLDMVLIELDSILRRDIINNDLIDQRVNELSMHLLHGKKKNISKEDWYSRIHYRWNNDSLVLLINARKENDIGYQNEVILNQSDSVLYINRFLIIPAEDPVKFTFIESYHYLEKDRVIKAWSKLMTSSMLSDTLAFRKMSFNDITKEAENYFNDELEYCRNIENYN